VFSLSLSLSLSLSPLSSLLSLVVESHSCKYTTFCFTQLILS
jgi:hypothetical protein